jgi:undecaprenyl-diphosphatase
MIKTLIENKTFLTLFIISIALMMIVQMGLTHKFDMWGVEFFRNSDNSAISMGGESVKSFVMMFTHTGDSKFLILIALICCFFCYRKYGKMFAGKAFVAFIGSFLLTAVLKALFGRMRPDIVPQFVEATSASFPSGHTLRSMVVYFLVAFLFLQGHSSNTTRALVAFLAGAMIIFNGLSRVYLGVHWPTDVFAGWLIGSCWVLFCIKYLSMNERQN